MSPHRNQGRLAGLLYIAASIPCFIGLAYVPGKLMVQGDANATAHNLVAFETFFRFGIAANLVGQGMFLLVALALYRLLKGVNPRLALLMLTLILLSIPISFLNEMNSIAALALARGASFLSVFDEPQRNALAMLFFHLRGEGFAVAGIFWGLWLFPLGMLVYRSGFLPRILGVLLMICCFSYLAESFAALVLPRYAGVVSRWVSPLQLLEVLFMVWLAIMGARPKVVADEG